MKSLRIIVISCLVCSLSSCGLIGPLFRLPGSVMKSIGASGLTDDAPEPIKSTDQQADTSSEGEDVSSPE